LIGSGGGFTDRFLEQIIAMQQRPFLIQGRIKMMWVAAQLSIRAEAAASVT
jgi:hypothetical protein